MPGLLEPLLGDAADRIGRVLDPARLAIGFAVGGAMVLGLVFIGLGIDALLEPWVGPGVAWLLTGTAYLLVGALVLLLMRPRRTAPLRAVPHAASTADGSLDPLVAELARRRPLASLGMAFALGALDGWMEQRRRR